MGIPGRERKGVPTTSSRWEGTEKVPTQSGVSLSQPFPGQEDEGSPDIPFLGINRVIYMKKSVDPYFRSR